MGRGCVEKSGILGGADGEGGQEKEASAGTLQMLITIICLSAEQGISSYLKRITSFKEGSTFSFNVDDEYAWVHYHG